MSHYRLTRLATRDFDKIIDELDKRSRTAAKRIAIAWPMPLLAPVTRATLSFSLIGPLLHRLLPSVMGFA